MAFLRLLFYGGFIFITAIASFVDENLRESLIALNPDNVVPVHYDVKLISYFKEDKERDEIFELYKTDIEKYQVKGSIVFYGELKVAIDVLHPTTNIRLNTLKSILPLDFDLMRKGNMLVKYLVRYYKYDAATQTCVFYFNVELSRGSYILNIKFLNAINNTKNIIIPLNDVLQKESEQYMWSDATHFQAIGARQLFPCWDKPTIKATFNISIKYRREYKVFSNMPIREEEICKDEEETYMKWTYFDITPAISSYILTIVITPITTLDIVRTNYIIVWYKPGLYKHIEYAQTVANEIMLQLKGKWENLKISTVQFVALSDFLYENQNCGLVLNRETSITYDENLHSVAHKINIARLIGREITYQWFGNLINPLWSSHLWLIDGLAILFAMDAINSIERYRNSEMLDLFIVQAQFESLRLDTHFFMKPLITETNPYEINSLSFFPRYIKAPLILRMLQCLITDEVFRDSIYLYLNKHAFNSTTPDDFWAVMQTAVDKSYDDPELIKRDILPLTIIIKNWSRHMSYPVLKITRDYSKNSMNIAIYMNIENHDTVEEDLFWIPVTYTTQNEANFRNLKHPFSNQRLLLIRTNKSFERVMLNEDGWVIFNLQQAGYYRVNYDPENWRKIAKYLNSNEYRKIHVLNRAKIIDDAFYFVIEHQLDSSIFWELTSYLSRETNYIAWYPMIKAFEYMSSIFPLPNEKVRDIKDKITKMLRFLFWNINYEEDANESDLIKCLRQEAIKWACILDDSQCQRKAYDKLLMHIEKLDTNKLLPWWKEWIYCKGLMLANNSIWHKVLKILRLENKIDRVPEFLACASNNVANEHLELLMLARNEDFDQIYIKSINSFLFIIAKHAKHNDVLSNILRNFDKLKPRDINMFLIFIVIVNHVYSEEQLDEIRKNMRNIIELEVYINHIKRMYEKNESPFDRATIEAYFYEYKNHVKQWMLYAERKLQMRLFEIERQINYLHNFSQ